MNLLHPQGTTLGKRVWVPVLASTMSPDFTIKVTVIILFTSSFAEIV